MSNLSCAKGFTLMEMLITVGIIGVIAAVGYPSYIASTQKSGRAEAKAELTDVAQRLQRCYTTLGVFNDAVNCPVLAELAANGGLGIQTRGRGFYMISLAANPALSAVAFQLNAVPTAGLPQVQDVKCALFTLNQAGVRSAFDSNNVTNTMCW